MKNMEMMRQPIGDKAELLSGSWEKRFNFHPASLKHCISVKEAVENYI
jgi:hypothetical protein